jgi:adenylate cyclase
MGDFSTAFNTMTRQLKDSREQLERQNKFIRETFGRYTSDEVVEVLLDMPEGLKLGGEKREVTILMSDLRGFTALAERLEPTEVVSLLNHYLSAMVEVIHRHGGTIDEIIGDAILVIFGAPVAAPDAARRAVCCALEMQLAMQEVNEFSLEKGWPEIEMGIALHTGEVVVGNIGSTRRSKYGVVGRSVNLTARIESFTVGGQVLGSPTLIGAAGPGLILGEEVEVHAKGMRESLRCRDLLGHEDYPGLSRPNDEAGLTTLLQPLSCCYQVLAGKHFDGSMQPASLVSISRRRAVVIVHCELPQRANLLLRLDGGAGDSSELYAKVLRPFDESARRYLIHFTSVPLAVKGRLQWLTDGGKGPQL